MYYANLHSTVIPAQTVTVIFVERCGEMRLFQLSDLQIAVDAVAEDSEQFVGEVHRLSNEERIGGQQLKPVHRTHQNLQKGVINVISISRNSRVVGKTDCSTAYKSHQ